MKRSVKHALTSAHREVGDEFSSHGDTNQKASINLGFDKYQLCCSMTFVAFKNLVAELYKGRTRKLFG